MWPNIDFFLKQYIYIYIYIYICKDRKRAGEQIDDDYDNDTIQKDN